MVKTAKPFRHTKRGHTKREIIMAEKHNLNLTVKLSLKQANGMTIEVSTWCADWEMTQKFLSQFENTLLKGNNGKIP
jgi:hypothetical protein